MNKFLIKLNRILLLVVLLFAGGVVSAQTTGKIAGTLHDANTGEAMIGANIMLDGTTMGTASDIEGNFFILNIPPGKYDLVVRVIGYETLKVKDVIVSVNRTSNLELTIKESVLELGEEVVVTADKVSMKKDQTSSIRNVNSEQIEALPVENLSSVVEMQAGVVEGHFRGGRSTEVSYMIDGLQVDNSFTKSSRNVDVETAVIQEVEVITGTFNAEYGRAMSGIVNAVTKDGAAKLSGSASIGASTYLTSHDDIFKGLDDIEIRNKDYKLFLTGPIYKNYISFLVNGRYQDNKNHLNGIELFNPNDYTTFQSLNSEEWISEKNGSGDYVPFNTFEEYSIFGKISLKPISEIRSSFTYVRNDSKSRGYSHFWKYNPSGLGYDYNVSDMVSFQLNHSLTNAIFYEVKASWLRSSYKHYLFEDALDPGYISDFYARSDPGFLTGGQDKTWTDNVTTDINTKIDFTWQVNKNHILKTGINYVRHEQDAYSAEIRNKYFNDPGETVLVYDSLTNKYYYPNYQPVVLSDSSRFTTASLSKPIEAAFYIQDKMEFESMVVNFGIRFDYFDANTTYPSDWQNPDNSISFSDDNADKRTTYIDAEAQYQISPRLGLSYQLGESALLRFAYGHFFQMPPLNALYANPNFLVSPFDFGTLMGNPTIKPEKTIQYEVGLWQQLNENMSVEVAVYYRDIYDLLGTSVISTYNSVRYGLYTNLDYGNVKGMEVKYDFFYNDFSVYANYTLQFTRGNANNPQQSFTRAGGNLDPVNKLFRLDWDQRHTINVTFGYNPEGYGLTATAYYNSGTPYTWEPLNESQLALVTLDINNATRPTRFHVDLRGYVDLFETNYASARLNLLVKNLFDTLLENSVYSTTGRAYETIVRDYEIAGWRSDFNTIYDPIQNPGMYGAPREVKLMLEVNF